MPEIEPVFAEGVRLLLARDFSGAERACEQALGVNPGRAQGWYLLGRARQELGKLEEAVQAHRRAVELQPGLAEAHNNLGIVLKKLGRTGEALSSLREAVRLRPDYLEARNNLGNTLSQLDHRDEAIECFRHIIRSKPDYAEAHNNLGLALKGDSQWAEAERSLREAVRLRPDFAAAFTNLGIVLTELGEHDQAMACYTRALALPPPPRGGAQRPGLPGRPARRARGGRDDLSRGHSSCTRLGRVVGQPRLFPRRAGTDLRGPRQLPRGDSPRARLQDHPEQPSVLPELRSHHLPRDPARRASPRGRGTVRRRNTEVARRPRPVPRAAASHRLRFARPPSARRRVLPGADPGESRPPPG